MRRSLPRLIALILISSLAMDPVLAANESRLAPLRSTPSACLTEAFANRQTHFQTPRSLNGSLGPQIAHAEATGTLDIAAVPLTAAFSDKLETLRRFIPHWSQDARSLFARMQEGAAQAVPLSAIEALEHEIDTSLSDVALIAFRHPDAPERLVFLDLLFGLLNSTEPAPLLRESAARVLATWARRDPDVRRAIARDLLQARPATLDPAELAGWLDSSAPSIAEAAARTQTLEGTERLLLVLLLGVESPETLVGLAESSEAPIEARLFSLLRLSELPPGRIAPERLWSLSKSLGPAAEAYATRRRHEADRARELFRRPLLAAEAAQIDALAGVLTQEHRLPLLPSAAAFARTLAAIRELTPLAFVRGSEINLGGGRLRIGGEDVEQAFAPAAFMQQAVKHETMHQLLFEGYGLQFDQTLALEKSGRDWVLAVMHERLADQGAALLSHAIQAPTGDYHETLRPSPTQIAQRAVHVVARLEDPMSQVSPLDPARYIVAALTVLTDPKVAANTLAETESRVEDVYRSLTSDAQVRDAAGQLRRRAAGDKHEKSALAGALRSIMWLVGTVTLLLSSGLHAHAAQTSARFLNKAA